MPEMTDRAAPAHAPPETTTVAYPGREGAHSAAACELLFLGGAELVPLPSFSAVVDATVEGSVEFGVLPIESSLSGPVAETHDLLYDSAVAIAGETVLPIRHCLVGAAEVPLEDVRLVRSHPVALDQCRRLLAAMPWATAIAAPTTADAAAQVAADADPAEAAIASERAAALHGLTVIVGDVGDHPEAYTRFVSLATYTRLDRNGGAWRTAFSFVTDHQPGALHGAIEPFARQRIDLLQLVSRPIPQTPWRYRFDAVLDGHPLDPIVHEALADLRTRTRRLRVFGSYPANGHA
jgi:prephenate dehydratase